MTWDDELTVVGASNRREEIDGISNGRDDISRDANGTQMASHHFHILVILTMSDREDIVELGFGISSSSIPKQLDIIFTRQFFPLFPQQQIEVGAASSSKKCRSEISNGEENTKSYPIPHDLQMVIAESLPVISLLRFLSVSKLWKSTISGEDFINSYMTKSLTQPQQRQGLLFTFICRDKCLVFSSPRVENCDEASSSSIATYNMTYHSQSQITIAPSVHGFICYGPASGLVIYNPCTRRSIFLPSINTRNKKISHYIEYDPVDSGYKVLCVTSGRPQMGNNLGLAEELYVLKMGKEHSWRMVEDIPHHYPTCSEICINGVLYYGAFTSTYLTQPAIMSFDVRSEEFHLIKGPDNASDKFLSSSKLTSYEGKVAVLFFENRAVY